MYKDVRDHHLQSSHDQTHLQFQNGFSFERVPHTHVRASTQVCHTRARANALEMNLARITGTSAQTQMNEPVAKIIAQHDTTIVSLLDNQSKL
jgi:hypothetical protein